MFLTFGWMFWRCTRYPEARHLRRPFMVLSLQTLLGILVEPNLLLLMSVEVPFVLPGRRALLWMGGQTIFMGAYWLLGAYTRYFEPLSGLSYLPPQVSVAVTILYILAIEVLAFCMGYMAVTEAQGRQELTWVNAELQATQGLLADSNRLAERVRIARELHDSLGHHLTVLNVNLELAKQLAEEKGTTPLREAQDVTRLLLGDVREVVSSLREDRSLDLRTALETLIAGISEPRTHLTLPDDLRIEDPAQAHALFRCAQEAITNVVRHAQARNLWLEVAMEEGGLALTARDDGRGVSAVSPGNGLRGMRERLEEVGGRLEIDARPGAGFSLRASIPVPGGLA